MALSEMNYFLAGGGIDLTLFLNSDANNGNVSWDYDAKCVMLTLINDTYNHVILIDLSKTSSSDTMYVCRNAASNNKWYTAHISDAGLTISSTSRSLNMSLPSGYIVNMVLPLPIDFPTSIPS